MSHVTCQKHTLYPIRVTRAIQGGTIQHIVTHVTSRESRHVPEPYTLYPIRVMRAIQKEPIQHITNHVTSRTRTSHVTCTSESRHTMSHVTQTGQEGVDKVMQYTYMSHGKHFLFLCRSFLSRKKKMKKERVKKV